MTLKRKRPNETKPVTSDAPRDDTRPGFFRRWSERKQRTRAGREDDSDAGAASSVPQAENVGNTDEAERVLTDEDMPPLESLNEDSDYSGFFSPGVSEQLRRAALRKLFSSAKLNVVDGLDDYAEDYRSFEALGAIITADMRFDMRREAERAKKTLDEKTREVAEDTGATAIGADKPAEERAHSESDADYIETVANDPNVNDSGDGDTSEDDKPRTG